jgi:opacity protein-like surface antigen
MLTASAVLSGSAAAQQRSGPAPVRGYLIGGGGAAIEPNRSASISAEIAENVHPNIQIYANAAYYDNLLSDASRNQLTAVAQELTIATGTPWEFSGRDQGRSFSFGAKLVKATGGMRPYVGAGIGVLNVRRTIVERFRGNLTDSFVAEFGSADGVLDVTQTNTNKPLGEVGAGVGFVVGRRGYVDFGYRYRKPFHTPGPSSNISNVNVAAGVKF